MCRVFEKARGVLQKLRPPEIASTSLERALADFGNEFRPPGTCLRIRIAGHPRVLDTTIQEQIQLIAREAVNNAFRHSNATIIDAEIEYLRGGLKVSVQDNGSGIDRKMICSWQSSRFGILGMHERARSIGARLCMRTKEGSGTEV